MTTFAKILLGLLGFQIDTVTTFQQVNPNDLAFVEGQIVISTKDGYILLQSGESWVPTFNGFSSQLDSDGIYLYLLFHDGIRVFTSNGRFTGKVVPGRYKGFSLSSGSTIFALHFTGDGVTRWDYRGRKYLDFKREETALKILGVEDGFALVFQNKTVIYDENGFPVDSIDKPTDWVYILNGIRGYLWSDTLQIGQVQEIVDSVISVFPTNSYLYILQSRGSVLGINLNQIQW